MVKVAEPSGDQTHVVVKGQPTDEYVPRSDLKGFAHGPDIGQQVGMGQHNAFGIAGAAGCILQKGNIARFKDRRGERPRPGHQFLHRHHFQQAFHPGSQQAGKSLGLGNGDHGPAQAVFDDGGMADQVFLDLVGPARRIDGNRHPAGVKDTEKTEKIIPPRRQHDDYRLAGLKVSLLKAGGDFFGARFKVLEGDDLAFPIVAVKADVRPVGVEPAMPVQHFRQSLGGAGQVPGSLGKNFADIKGGQGISRPGPTQDRTENFARRFGSGERLFRQGHPEMPFDPDHHLDPGQTVQAEVLIQRTVQRHRHIRQVRTKLGRHLADLFKQQGRHFLGPLAVLAVVLGFAHAIRVKTH